MIKTAVIVPNWNGFDTIAKCLDSLLKQTEKIDIILVENGSTDRSLSFIKDTYPNINLIINRSNRGFAGGVNDGIRLAFNLKYEYIALFNNDAVASKDWISSLTEHIENNPKVGIVTSKILSINGEYIDSTGDFYTNWGLPFPRGRNEKNSVIYDSESDIFSASGGASIYRTKMLHEIGIFDEDFFAYYEDVDISFRAQLAGWKVNYEPKAMVLHDTGSTSSKIKGFTTYQTMKNLPWLFWKNVPLKYLIKIGLRFYFAYFTFYLSAFSRGQGFIATKGLLKSVIFLPKKLFERRKIQSHKKVDSDYIWNIITHDLPPNAFKLRALRYKWRRIINKVRS